MWNRKVSISRKLITAIMKCMKCTKLILPTKVRRRFSYCPISRYCRFIDTKILLNIHIFCPPQIIRTIIDNKKCEICVSVRNVYFKRYLWRWSCRPFSLFIREDTDIIRSRVTRERQEDEDFNERWVDQLENNNYLYRKKSCLTTFVSIKREISFFNWN